jgi:hypothetical protein
MTTNKASLISTRILIQWTLGLSFVLLFGSSLVWAKGAPTTHQTAKDFKNLIIQGERPEIVACMAATLHEIKGIKTYEAFRWTDGTSKTALMHETEIDGHLRRSITLQAQAILSSQSFFDLVSPIQVQCEQLDEGYPKVRITLVQ